MKHKTMARRYLREAVLALALARFAVRFLPAAWILAWARRAPRRINRFAVTDAVTWVPWAIETVGSKPWMHAAACRAGWPRRPCCAGAGSRAACVSALPATVRSFRRMPGSSSARI